MSTLFIVEAMNLYMGDPDPVNSKHLAIEDVKLPGLTEMFADHHGGGARMQIEIPVGIQKLEPTFKMVGFDPHALGQFGLSSRHSRPYTMYGEVRDRRTGVGKELKAQCEARLGKIESDTFKRGELTYTEYALQGLTHYEIHFDGAELLYWDFFTNQWRVNGVDQNAETNSILRIPNTGV